jgi:methyltransferase-like protein/SAM-dependent methyltransferase
MATDMLSNLPSTNPAAPPVGPNSYDEVPYESHPFAQTHPERLFTVGTLFGLRPTPLAKCRVLELGCAAGGNLIPMADYLPESHFVGCDLSEKQIKEGQEYVSKLGLKNLDLRHASIMDVDESWGTFDYVICHGVFSWVPDVVQDKIYDICAKQMSPSGIAYISYNTYPGWRMRGMIRDMMRYHSGRFNTPQLRTQQARALLDFLTQSVKQDGSAYSILLKQELETLRHQADHYLYHEHLEENNEPLYFHQFAERAKSRGLKYLGEARIGTMVTSNFGPEIEKTLKILATDQIQAEQYMDFLRNRMFRESLLVKSTVNPNWAVNPENLRHLHVASGARAVGPDGQPLTTTVNIATEDNVSYRSGSGMTMATNRPILKAVIQVLSEVYSTTMPFDALRKAARERIGNVTTDPKQIVDDTNMIAVGLLNCYMSSDLVELHGMPIQFNKKPSETPAALPWARLQATKQTVVTNRRHEVIRTNDLDKQLIPLMDGKTAKPEIVEKLADVASRGLINVQKDGMTLHDPKDVKEAIKSIIDQAIQNVANQGLVV